MNLLYVIPEKALLLFRELINPWTVCTANTGYLVRTTYCAVGFW